MSLQPCAQPKREGLRKGGGKVAEQRQREPSSAHSAGNCHQLAAPLGPAKARSFLSAWEQVRATAQAHPVQTHGQLAVFSFRLSPSSGEGVLDQAL